MKKRLCYGCAWRRYNHTDRCVLKGSIIVMFSGWEGEMFSAVVNVILFRISAPIVGGWRHDRGATEEREKRATGVQTSTKNDVIGHRIVSPRWSV